MTESMQKLKKNLALIVGLSFLMIPTGLLLWLIFSWGWKIAIAALIIGVASMVIYFAVDKIAVKNELTDSATCQIRKRIIDNYEQGKPITDGIKDYDIYKLALDK